MKGEKAMKNLLSSIIMIACMLACASCTDMIEDDGSRAFANVATIVGDAESGFYCYQRHYGGLVISHSQELVGKERGYFTFSYMESDWKTSASGMKYIDNARVCAIEAYDVVHPLTQEEADSRRIMQLCYNPRVPDGWTKTSSDYRTVSCDISSLASLQEWNDSLTLVIDDGSKEKHLIRMSRNDFSKPVKEGIK